MGSEGQWIGFGKLDYVCLSFVVHDFVKPESVCIVSDYSEISN